MRLNYEICLIGQKTILVPYRPEHIEKYHKWLQDPHLLEMTGSEPLSMEEEVAMQKSWRDDDSKCTFIVLDREACVGLSDTCTNGAGNEERADNGDMISVSEDFVERNLSAMIGDVNLFLSDEEQDDETDYEHDGGGETRDAATAATSDSLDPKVSKEDTADVIKQAELDIMIAEKSAQGKGMGSEASRIMMLYGAECLGIRRYFAKIKKENNASITLFGDRLKFVECNYVECFGEYEYGLRRDSATDMADTMQKDLGFDVIQCTCRLKST